jgi:ribosomal-protein-alanine N-acetyltransferase
MKPIKLYPVKPPDLGDILIIERESFLSPWTYNMFLNEISNPLSRSFAAKEENPRTKILGYIFYQVVAFEMHILNIAVHPSFRSKGIGTTLFMESIKKENAEKNARYAFLEVRENNARAIRLYQKFGFKELGLRKNYYRKENANAIIMGRPIG